MAFLLKVFSGSERLKEKQKSADIVNEKFRAELNDVQTKLEVENYELQMLVEMIYDSSYPESQKFLKQPTKDRLYAHKEIISSLLFGLAAQGFLVAPLILTHFQKYGCDAIADTLINLLELVRPLLASKDMPEFTSDDILDAIDIQWHSSVRSSPAFGSLRGSTAASPLQSPRVSFSNLSPRQSFSNLSPRQSFSNLSPRQSISSPQSPFSMERMLGSSPGQVPPYGLTSPRKTQSFSFSPPPSLEGARAAPPRRSLSSHYSASDVGLSQSYGERLQPLAEHDEETNTGFGKLRKHDDGSTEPVAKDDGADGSEENFKDFSTAGHNTVAPVFPYNLSSNVKKGEFNKALSINIPRSSVSFEVEELNEGQSAGRTQVADDKNDDAVVEERNETNVGSLPLGRVNSFDKPRLDVSHEQFDKSVRDVNAEVPSEGFSTRGGGHEDTARNVQESEVPLHDSFSPSNHETQIPEKDIVVPIKSNHVEESEQRGFEMNWEELNCTDDSLTFEGGMEDDRVGIVKTVDIPTPLQTQLQSDECEEVQEAEDPLSHNIAFYESSMPTLDHENVTVTVTDSPHAKEVFEGESLDVPKLSPSVERCELDVQKELAPASESHNEGDIIIPSSSSLLQGKDSENSIVLNTSASSLHDTEVGKSAQGEPHLSEGGAAVGELGFSPWSEKSTSIQAEGLEYTGDSKELADNIQNEMDKAEEDVGKLLLGTNSEGRDEAVDAVAGDGPVDAVAGDGPVDAVAGDEPVGAVAGDGPVQAIEGDGPGEAIEGDGAVETIEGDGPVEAIKGDGPGEAIEGDRPVDGVEGVGAVDGNEGDKDKDGNSPSTLIPASSVENDNPLVSALIKDKEASYLSPVGTLEEYLPEKSGTQTEGEKEFQEQEPSHPRGIVEIRTDTLSQSSFSDDYDDGSTSSSSDDEISSSTSSEKHRCSSSSDDETDEDRDHCHREHLSSSFSSGFLSSIDEDETQAHRAEETSGPDEHVSTNPELDLEHGAELHTPSYNLVTFDLTKLSRDDNEDISSRSSLQSEGGAVPDVTSESTSCDMTLANCFTGKGPASPSNSTVSPSTVRTGAPQCEDGLFDDTTSEVVLSSKIDGLPSKDLVQNESVITSYARAKESNYAEVFLGESSSSQRNEVFGAADSQMTHDDSEAFFSSGAVDNGSGVSGDNEVIHTSGDNHSHNAQDEEEQAVSMTRTDSEGSKSEDHLHHNKAEKHEVPTFASHFAEGSDDFEVSEEVASLESEQDDKEGVLSDQNGLNFADSKAEGDETGATGPVSDLLASTKTEDEPANGLTIPDTSSLNLSSTSDEGDRNSLTDQVDEGHDKLADGIPSHLVQLVEKTDYEIGGSKYVIEANPLPTQGGEMSVLSVNSSELALFESQSKETSGQEDVLQFPERDRLLVTEGKRAGVAGAISITPDKDMEVHVNEVIVPCQGQDMEGHQFFDMIPPAPEDAHPVKGAAPQSVADSALSEKEEELPNRGTILEESGVGEGSEPSKGIQTAQLSDVLANEEADERKRSDKNEGFETFPNTEEPAIEGTKEPTLRTLDGGAELDEKDNHVEFFSGTATYGVFLHNTKFLDSQGNFVRALTAPVTVARSAEVLPSGPERHSKRDSIICTPASSDRSSRTHKNGRQRRSNFLRTLCCSCCSKPSAL